MDFIERLIGWSPDRGDGSVEVLLILGLIGIVVGLALRLPKALSANSRLPCNKNGRYSINSSARMRSCSGT
jgi:uncharacterized iron-regulated membrane protein